MPRMVRCGLIQASNPLDNTHPLSKIKKAMIDKHLKLMFGVSPEPGLFFQFVEVRNSKLPVADQFRDE